MLTVADMKKNPAKFVEEFLTHPEIVTAKASSSGRSLRVRFDTVTTDERNALLKQLKVDERTWDDDIHPQDYDDEDDEEEY